MKAVEWYQEDVIQKALAVCQGRLETGAKVVEVDARRRLLKIREPAFGAKYRRLLALYRLTSFVTIEGREVLARVGIPKGEKGGDYGFWIEVGSRTAPAHPWLRPALMGSLKTVMGLFET